MPVSNRISLVVIVVPKPIVEGKDEPVRELRALELTHLVHQVV